MCYLWLKRTLQKLSDILRVTRINRQKLISTIKHKTELGDLQYLLILHWFNKLSYCGRVNCTELLSSGIVDNRAVPWHCWVLCTCWCTRVCVCVLCVHACIHVLALYRLIKRLKKRKQITILFKHSAQLGIIFAFLFFMCVFLCLFLCLCMCLCSCVSVYNACSCVFKCVYICSCVSCIYVCWGALSMCV